MSLSLNLGVLDVQYSDATGNGTTSTGKVAAILEARYGVMQSFFDSRKDQIAGWLADSMAESIEMLVKGGTAIAGSGKSSTRFSLRGQQRTLTSEHGSLTYGADQKIENAFREFLDADELSKLSAGLSAAATAGQSKRFKSGHTPKRRPRPAFIDTGLYRTSFRAWTSNT